MKDAAVMTAIIDKLAQTDVKHGQTANSLGKGMAWESHESPLISTNPPDMNTNHAISRGSPLLALQPESPRFGLQHQRSCTFTNATLPCIKKATTNLAQMQDRLEEWKRELINCDAEIKAKTMAETMQKQAEDAQRMKSGTNKKLAQIESGRMLEIVGSSLDGQSTTDTNNNSPSRADTRSDTLSLSAMHSRLSHNSHIDGIPQEVEGVLHGVYHLLGRLETDRVNTAQTWEQEKERVARLSEKIDMHAYRRMHDLPKAVQEEHEKCAENITELKWHVEYRHRILNRLKDRVKQAETINKRIRDDISYVEDNNPLLDSKLEMERRATQAVQNKQDTTDRELKLALDQLHGAEDTFEKTRSKIEVEQRAIKKRIDAVTHDFEMTRDTFTSLENDSRIISEEMGEVNQKVRKAEGDLQELEKKQKNTIALEHKEKEKVADLRQDIENQKERNTNFEEENEKIKEKFDLERDQILNKKQALEQQIKQRTGDYKKLVYQNRAFEKDIKNLLRQIAECKKQQNADAKAVLRSSLEKEKIDDGLKVITEEADQIRMIHERLVMRVEQERQRVAEVEENLTVQGDLLKKQVKDESHARIILQARIASETAEFGKKKLESEKKRGKILKTKEEIDKVTEQVKGQVDKLTGVHEKRLNVIEGIQSLLGQVAVKRNDMETGLKSEIVKMEPIEENLKKELTDILSKADTMSSSDAEMTKKMESMEASMIMMQKVIAANQNTIEVLEEDLAELTIERDSGLGREESLRSLLQGVTDRSTSEEEAFEARMADRNEFLANTKIEMDKATAENKQLAADYNRLQDAHINKRMEFTTSYEKSLNATGNLKDTEIICDLHGRLHSAMKSYYRLRGLQTRAGLSRFEELNAKNSKRLIGIEGELEVALRNIEMFLDQDSTGPVRVRCWGEEEEETSTMTMTTEEPPQTPDTGMSLLAPSSTPGATAKNMKSAPLRLLPRGRGNPSIRGNPSKVLSAVLSAR